MNTTALLSTLMLSFPAMLLAAESEKPQTPFVEVTELAPKHDGKTVQIKFAVEHFYMISGTVPVGQIPSYGIQPVLAEDSPKMSVLVMGELADVLRRFGAFAPAKSLDGAEFVAVGKIKLFPADPAKNRKEASYQFQISDWKQFHVVSYAHRDEAKQAELTEEMKRRLQREVEKLDKAQKVLGGNVRSLPKNE